MTGRFVFGLGGECMTVAQSAIVSNWFKGKELSFAFGFNLTIARIGSVINGITVPLIANNSSVATALYVGFAICLFSLLNAFCLAIVDWYADKKDGKKVTLSSEDKFHWSDLKTFKLPFWLICASCVFVYMSVFPYLQIASGMMQKKFGFSEE